MLFWFVTIGALGLWGVAQNASVFRALNPCYAFNLLATSGFNGFLVLGGIFLCVTGAEALYADMGHFGKAPIRLSWSLIVFSLPFAELCRPMRHCTARRIDR